MEGFSLSTATLLRGNGCGDIPSPRASTSSQREKESLWGATISPSASHLASLSHVTQAPVWLRPKRLVLVRRPTAEEDGSASTKARSLEPALNGPRAKPGLSSSVSHVVLARPPERAVRIAWSHAKPNPLSKTDDPPSTCGFPGMASVRPRPPPSRAWPSSRSVPLDLYSVERSSYGEWACRTPGGMAARAVVAPWFRVECDCVIIDPAPPSSLDRATLLRGGHRLCNPRVSQ